MEDKEVFNPSVEGEFTPEDFNLVHRKAGEKLHDTKMQSKPTTFAKDALKRFMKNKSSVVAAVIIGILLLASFIAPLASPYSTTKGMAEISKMVPRIRNADNGFWDGTISYKHQTYDEINEVPVGFEKRCIVKDSLKYDGIQYQSGDPKMGYVGGYMRVRSDYTKDNLPMGKTDYTFYQTYKTITMKPEDELKMTVTFGVEDGIEGDKLVNPSIYLYGEDDMAEKILLPVAEDVGPNQQAKPLALIDGSEEESNASEGSEEVTSEEEAVEVDGEFTRTFDLSGALADAGYTSLLKARPRIHVALGEDVLTYILIKEIKITCGEAASEKVSDWADVVSWNDANGQGLSLNTDDYWQSNGRRLILNSYRHTVSFLYDQYEKVLGTREDIVIGRSILKDYIAKGWCEMDDLDDISTFRLTNPDSNLCPVRSMIPVEDLPEEWGTTNPRISHLKDGTNVYEYKCSVLAYRYYGFDEMPIFVFGTDANGYDMLTLSLACLKNSLLLAIISSAVCMVIGLIWGSISGYFGGSVDLIMERITDILSGVPWIVVMTLVMLLLGRTVLTFGIAICLTGWIGTASRTRTQFYRFKGREYVLASRTLGASDGRLIFRHILPNGLGTLVTGSVLMIPSTIFSEATLSYLGLGLQGTASFGVLLSDNQANLSSRPMLVIWPAIIISLLMISFNLFGNGLRDALNPTLKGGEQ